MPVARLHLHLLGSFRLYQGDQLLAGFDQPRLQHLLAFLALHRAAIISRQQLAFTFWPDTSDRQARKNLRTLLARLRQALPDADEFLCITAQALQWQANAPIVVDVAEFEAAVAAAIAAYETDGHAKAVQALAGAVAAYTGDLLPTCYDDWILPLRERLRQAYGAALERLVVALEEQSDYGDAIPYAQRLLHHDPLHEAAYRHMMRLHLAQGNRTEALRAYHACETMLKREFGTVPSRATSDLHEALLSMDGLPLSTARHSLEARPDALPLVSREAEWSLLVSAWREASAGRPQMILLTGEAGIGKTRLVDDLQWADRETLDWLLYLLYFDPSASLLIAGTLREHDIGIDHPMTASRLALARAGLLREVSLAPFDAKDTALLAAEATVLEELDELWRRQIIRPQGDDGYDFSHDGLRAVAYDEMGAIRRRSVHLRVAQALVEIHDDEQEAFSGQIAAHYEQGGQPQSAIAFYRRAAAAAKHLYANAEAVQLYRHLLEIRLNAYLSLQERCTLLLALGEVWQATGYWVKAQTVNQLPIRPETHRRIRLYYLQGEVGGIVAAGSKVLETFVAELERRGFEVTVNDGASRVKGRTLDYRQNVDAALIVADIVGYGAQNNYRIQWKAAMSNECPWYVWEAPTVMVSLNFTTHLHDATMVKCYIHAYHSNDEIIRQVVDKIMGESPFKGAPNDLVWTEKWQAKL